MTKSFEKEFWREALQDPFSIIINGNCYTFGSGITVIDGKQFGNECAGFKGFGGAKFKIEITEETPAFKKGTIVETTNLWHRGEIPKWCNAKNNAKCTKDSPTKV